MKRTPSRTTLSNTLSTRKRRRVSIHSFDLEAELGIPTTPEPAVEETDVSNILSFVLSWTFATILAPRQIDFWPFGPPSLYPFTPPLARIVSPSHSGF